MDGEGDLVFDAGVIEGEVTPVPQPSHGRGNGDERRGQEDDWDAHSPFLENGHGEGVTTFPPGRLRKRKENIGDKAGIVLVRVFFLLVLLIPLGRKKLMRVAAVLRRGSTTSRSLSPNSSSRASPRSSSQCSTATRGKRAGCSPALGTPVRVSGPVWMSVRRQLKTLRKC